MLLNDLQTLGLTKNEAATYLSVNESGKTKAGEIIKSTGLHRNLVYQALDSLAKSRLVTKTTTGKVASFQATDPSHLLDRIREQDLVAQKVIEELKTKAQISDQEITIYEGEEGMRAYNMKNAENLTKDDCIYVLGSGGEKFQRVMGTRAQKKYFSLIEKNGKAKILMYPKQRFNKELMNKVRSRPNYEVRVLPFNMTPSAGIVFTNSNVGIHIYEDPVLVIEIKNKHLIKTYKDYFDSLWKQETRIECGMEAFKNAFYEIINELNPGDEYYVIGANVIEDQTEYIKFFNEYHRARIKKGVKVKMLSYQPALKNITERFKREGDPKFKVSKIKPFSGPMISPMQTTIYNGKTLMVLTGNNPTIISFENKDVYEGFKTYFDELWNQVK